MLKQVAYRDGGKVVTEYTKVEFPRTAQPSKRRPVTVSQMRVRDLMRWRRQAWLADHLRSQDERDLLARAERLARESVAGFAPTNDLDDLLV
jgi:hypothetical protein